MHHSLTLGTRLVALMQRSAGAVVPSQRRCSRSTSWDTCTTQGGRRPVGSRTIVKGKGGPCIRWGLRTNVGVEERLLNSGRQWLDKPQCQHMPSLALIHGR